MNKEPSGSIIWPPTGKSAAKVPSQDLLLGETTRPHIIASLSAQCRQVYCLVEMAPSAPSRRHPRRIGVSLTASQAGENEQTNVASQRSFQAVQHTQHRRRRITPSDPSLIQPSRQSLAACPKRPNSSRAFINLNNSLNLESKE